MALKRLNDEHYHAMELLAEPKATRKSKQEISDIVGCHRNTLNNWLKDPLWSKEFRNLVRSSRVHKIVDVIDSVIDGAVKDGNSAQAKLFLQYQDELGSDSNVNVQVNNKGDYSPEMLDELRKNIAMNKSKENDEESGKE
jgi:Helix-turn-helix of insertion element transposase